MNTSMKNECEYWQDLSYTEKVEKIFTDGYLSDCKFIVGPDDKETETFSGHKIMFIMESPVFEKLLNGKFLESKDMSEVRINEFTPKDFKNFCFMIYNSDERIRQAKLMQLSAYEIIGLYSICHKYMISSILKQCFEYLKTNLINHKYSLDCIILIFEMAIGLNVVELLIPIEQAIVFGSLSFHDKLNDLPPEYFHKYMLIINKKNSVSQLDKFKALEAFILKNNLSEKDSVHTKRLLDLVDLKKMSPKTFISGPGNSSLYDWETKYKFVANALMQCNLRNNINSSCACHRLQ